MSNNTIQKQAALLYQKGFLSYSDYSKTLAVKDWKSWIQKQAFLFGAVLTLAGIVCFFAYNWANMGKLLKLGLPLFAFTALGLAAAFTGLNKTSSKILSLAAAFMIGVFCAVFGQTYQTGANAWQLFFTWALCILPLAVLSFSTGLWLLFLVIVNILLQLYPFDYSQNYFFNMLKMPVIYILLLNGLFFIIAEFCRTTGKKLFTETYFRTLVYIYLLGILFLSAMPEVLTPSKSDFGYLLLFTVLTGGSVYYFIKTKQAVTLIGLAALAAASIICAGIVRNFNSTADLLFTSILSVIVFGSAAYAVYRAHLYIRGAK